jgi:hypothetical protein
LRFLWAVSACVLLLTASAPAGAGAGPSWIDTSALVTVASAGSAEHRDAKAQVSRARPRRVTDGLRRRTTAVPSPVRVAATKPAIATEHLVLIPRRYLRNLSLLC